MIININKPVLQNVIRYFLKYNALKICPVSRKYKVKEFSSAISMFHIYGMFRW